MSPEGEGFSGPCHGHAHSTEGAQRDPAVGATPLPAELVCVRVELADGDGALPLLQHPHVGGASLSQGQVAIAQVDSCGAAGSQGWGAALGGAAWLAGA